MSFLGDASLCSFWWTAIKQKQKKDHLAKSKVTIFASLSKNYSVMTEFVWDILFCSSVVKIFFVLVGILKNYNNMQMAS